MECAAVLFLEPVVYGFADFTDLIVFALPVDDFVDLSVFGSLDFADISSRYEGASFFRLRTLA